MARKAALAIATLLFANNRMFMLAAVLLVLFASFGLQSRHAPYMHFQDFQPVLRQFKQASEEKARLEALHEMYRHVSNAAKESLQQSNERGNSQGKNVRHAKRKLARARAAMQRYAVPGDV